MKACTTLLLTSVFSLGLSLNGLAAEPVKGGQRLTQLAKPVAINETKNKLPNEGHCPMCKPREYSYVDASARGAFKTVITSRNEMCPSCETRLVTKGQGKNAIQEAQFACLKRCCDIENM